jgi:peptidoglycan/xylan/chitin deacetylase (PgdA/CDA1 family)
MRAIALIITLVAPIALGQVRDRTISVTIDDLPVVSTRSDLKNRRQITKKLLGHIKKAKVPAIGFVNENKLYTDGRPDSPQIELLELWLSAGLELGNHTFSHRSLNRIELEDYTDILKGEAIIRPLITSRGQKLRYFRHPYLQTGRSMDVKAKMEAFLLKHGYRIAPVSFDNADYIFSRAYDNAFDKKDKALMKQVGTAYVPYMEAKLDYWERQSQRLFGREISQTLLLHANFINSDYFDDLAAMLKKRGYRFVSLDESLKDDAYRLPDTYVGPAGISWLHRWAREKGSDYILPHEPTVPDFVLKASGFDSE